MFILTAPLPNPISGFNGNGNPSERLAEIRSKIADAENRVRDLEALLTDFILHPNGDSPLQLDIDGNRNGKQLSTPGLGDNPDANTVRQALYAARAYEGELRTAEQFWNQIVEGNKTAEKDTHDLFKRA